MNNAEIQRRAERAWEGIRANSDADLAEAKQQAESDFQEFRAALADVRSTGFHHHAERLQENFGLSLKVTRFVSRGFMFYALIRSKRELNEQEKALGKELTSLLELGMALIQSPEARQKLHE